MPLLLLLLVVGVFAWAWLARRGSTLTRACRWRLDRAAGADAWHCAACQARTRGPRTPRHCLGPAQVRGGGPPAQQ